MGAEYRVVHSLTRSGAGELYNPKRSFGFVTGANRSKFPCLGIPETNSGFLPQWWHGDDALTSVWHTPQGAALRATDQLPEEERRERMLALCFRKDVPSLGCYRVTVTLSAERGAREVIVFVGRRRLVWHGPMKAGSSITLSALCDVSPIVPRGQDKPISDPTLSVAVLCSVEDMVWLRSVTVEAVSARTVYIMGDSTVTDQTANLPYAPGASFAGWGQMIGAFLPEPLVISNHAHSGLTTESFTSGGHWDVVRPLMKAGDVCLIQFGHNDQKLAHLTARGGYSEHLRQYIGELRDAEVKPVLVTPLARNSWNGAGKYNDLLADYAEAVWELGQAVKVPVIDLHRYAMGLICGEGLECAKQWFFPGDFTHTNDFGAYKMAAYVAKELCSILGVEIKRVPKWECHGPFTVLEPPAGCELTPPADRTDPVAGLLAERPDDELSRVEMLELVIQLMRFFPINVYNDLYADVVGHETYAGTVQCAAQNGLVPKAWVEDGMLHPNQVITLADFFVALMPGYTSRHALDGPLPVSDAVPVFARDSVGLALRAGMIMEQAAWDRPLTRKQVADLLRNIKM